MGLTAYVYIGAGGRSFRKRCFAMSRRRVLAAGVFDILHYGHLRFLEEAKKAGGEGAELIVVVARDSTVLKLKGRKPIFPEELRRALVEALKPVDQAVLGYEDMNIEGVLEDLKPDVVALGYDQDHLEKAVREAAKKKGLSIEIVRLGRYGPKELNSSSKIARKLLESEPL